MSSLQPCNTSVPDMRLAAVIAAAANLKSQLNELQGLRERVRKTLEIPAPEAVQCSGLTQIPAATNERLCQR
jgi:hypothetical protein